MVMPNQSNIYGQNPLLQQQAPPQKKFAIPTWVFWTIAIVVLGVASWLVFF